MMIALLIAGLVTQPADTAPSPAPEQPATAQSDSLVGTVRVTGPAISRKVNIVAEGGLVALTGEMTQELGRLGSARVEVLGSRKASTFAVTGYRILDVGGGVRPLVGQVERAGDGLVLRDGEGEPIMLNAPPRTRARLEKKLGAKIWVSGKKLVSGELQISRYGILRDPPKK